MPVKGWDILIQAFARTIPVVPEAKLLLVGGIDAPNEIEFAGRLAALVEKYGISDKVLFLGRRQDVPAILRATDVFAFPSRSEEEKK